MGERATVSRTRPSSFGHYFELREAMPAGTSCVLFMAQGPVQATVLELLLPHQLYRERLEALRAAGYNRFAVCPVDTDHWADVVVDGA